jgi:hypothetical protein
MFTINIYLRFALILVFIAGGIILALTIGFWYAFPLLLIGIILFSGYLFLGTVQSAAQLLEKTDFLGAEKRLSLTLKPGWLYKTNRAYFYLIKGSIAAQFKNNEIAEELLLKAKTTGLPSDNERAMVQMQLAGLAANKNNWVAARQLLRETKSLNVTEPQLKDQLKQLEKGLKNQGAMQVARHRQRGMTFQPGGKRKRPRSR